jgi:hypothetical protein
MSLWNDFPTVWGLSANVVRTDATDDANVRFKNIYILVGRGARSGPMGISGRSQMAAHHV